MSNVYIVRHGQDTDNASGILNGWRDTSLTELGRSQAQETAEKLHQYNIDIICSSPLKRAQETANIIAGELGIDKIIVVQDLIERNFGIMAGKPVKDIRKYTDKIIEGDKVNYFLEVEGSESYPDLLTRAKKVLEEIKEKYPDKNILIVTHGDIGKMIRAANNNWTWEEGLKTPYFDNAEVIELK